MRDGAHDAGGAEGLVMVMMLKSQQPPPWLGGLMQMIMKMPMKIDLLIVAITLLLTIYYDIITALRYVLHRMSVLSTAVCNC